jgi:hypothetical protein
VDGQRDHRGQLGALDRLQRDERLLAVGEGLGDHEVNARLDDPLDLLVEHRPHRGAALVVGGEDVGVTEVAGQQASVLLGHVGGDLQGAAVERLEQLLLANEPQLLPMAVVGERLDDVGAGVHELTVQLGDELGVLEDDLRDESTRLEIAAALELEQVALGADDRSFVEPLEQRLLRVHRVVLAVRRDWS